MEDRTHLLEERAKAFEAIKALRDRQQEWSAEDRDQWSQLNDEFDRLSALIDNVDEQLRARARFDEIQARVEQEQHATRSEVDQARHARAVEQGTADPTEEQRCLALQGFLMRQVDKSITQRHEEALELCGLADKAGFDARVFRSSVRHGHGIWSTNNATARIDSEQRAMSTTGASGGFTIPEGFHAELERALLAFGGLRAIAQIISTSSGNDYPYPAADDTGNTGELLAEGGTIGSSVDPTFSSKIMKGYKYSSKPILVSAEILEDSAFNLSAVIGSMLGERIGRITSTHFATGDNSSKPQGATVGASAGVTAASATAVTADELISLQGSLDPAYSTGVTGWVMNNATLTEVRQLKDSQGQYLWQPGLQAGVPDRLLGRPVSVVQEMPDTATGNVAVLYGDFSKYLIRDAASARFYRLEERYRDNDQTGFVMFSRHDGRVLQSAAIKKLTMA